MAWTNITTLPGFLLTVPGSDGSDPVVTVSAGLIVCSNPGVDGGGSYATPVLASFEGDGSALIVAAARVTVVRCTNIDNPWYAQAVFLNASCDELYDVRSDGSGSELIGVTLAACASARTIQFGNSYNGGAVDIAVLWELDVQAAPQPARHGLYKLPQRTIVPGRAGQSLIPPSEQCFTEPPKPPEGPDPPSGGGGGPGSGPPNNNDWPICMYEFRPGGTNCFTTPDGQTVCDASSSGTWVPINAPCR